MKFSAREKADCAKREAGLRHRVYPNRVDTGRMTADQARKQIALMEEIEADYRRMADEEDMQGRLL